MSSEYSVVYMQFVDDDSARSYRGTHAGVFLLKIPAFLPDLIKNMILALVHAPVLVNQADIFFDFTDLQRTTTMPGYRFEYAASPYRSDIQDLCNVVLATPAYSTRIRAIDIVFTMIQAGLGTEEPWIEIGQGDIDVVDRIFGRFKSAHQYEHNSDDDDLSESIGRTGGSGLSESETRLRGVDEGLGIIDDTHVVLRLFLLRDASTPPAFAVCVRYYITRGGRRMFEVELNRNPPQ
jgi:hypothetical protein